MQVLPRGRGGCRLPCLRGLGALRRHLPGLRGNGEIARTRRRGIAVFPKLPGLYRYLAERGARVEDRIVVELEGRLSDDVDLDADTGALLLHPTGIVAVRPFDRELFELTRRSLKSPLPVADD